MQRGVSAIAELLVDLLRALLACVEDRPDTLSERDGLAFRAFAAWRCQCLSCRGVGSKYLDPSENIKLALKVKGYRLL